MEPTTLLILVLAVLAILLALLVARQLTGGSVGVARSAPAPPVDEWRLARLEKNVAQILERLGLDDAKEPNEPDAVVRDLIRAGNKIAAIRAYRQATGVSLKEAKDAVEALERSLPKP